jgi:hypothetical protein
MLVLASLLGCLDPVATAVASISAKSPFASAVSSERRLEVRQICHPHDRKLLPLSDMVLNIVVDLTLNDL